LGAVVVASVGGGERGAERAVQMGVELEGCLVVVFVLGGVGGGVVTVLVVVVVVGVEAIEAVVVVVVVRLRARRAFALSRLCCC
jgi:hypothetical protein